MLNIPLAASDLSKITLSISLLKEAQTLYHNANEISRSSRINGRHALSWIEQPRTASGLYSLRAPVREILVLDDQSTHPGFPWDQRP